MSVSLNFILTVSLSIDSNDNNNNIKEKNNFHFIVDYIIPQYKISRTEINIFGKANKK